MVGLFLRLRLRLFANAFRMGGAYVTGFVIMAASGLLGAIGLSLALATGPRSLSVVVYLALWIAWIVGPIVLSASDESLDAWRLVAFPLRRREVIGGLLAAALIGIGPAVSAVVLLGAVIGLSGGLAATVTATLGAIVELLLCVVTSRALTTTLSGILRSRRGRDIAAAAMVLIGLVPLASNLLLSRFVRGGPPGSALSRVVGVVRWTPPGMAAHASLDAGEGRLPLAAVELSAALAVFGALLALWAWSLGRLTVQHDASTKRVRATRGALARLGNAGRAGAVAARDLKYQWRDPRRRVLWVQVVVLMLFVLGPGGAAGPVFLVLGLCFVAIVLSMQAAQQFGYDGAAYWLHVSATRDRRDVASDLLGKAIAAVVITLPVLVLVVSVGTLARGRSHLLPVAVVAVVGAYAIGLACATLLSVWFPVPLPDSSRNVFGSVDPGRGCLAGVAGLGAMLLALAVAAAFAVPLVRSTNGAATVGLSLGLLAMGAAAGIGARRWASRIAFGRMPEILAAVTPRGG